LTVPAQGDLRSDDPLSLKPRNAVDESEVGVHRERPRTINTLSLPPASGVAWIGRGEADDVASNGSEERRGWSRRIEAELVDLPT
jgi:hypothetical protein